jgi:ribosome biogenesis GTPase A
MSINWFPGHMVTARKEAMEAMRQTDVVIEVLDARVPHSSCNPMFETLRRENQRPALKVLNKADLADPKRTLAWLAHYNAQAGVKAIALSAKSRPEVARIPDECASLAPSRGTGAKPLRMMILGIPNVGKSTLMNTLLKRRVAKVGDEPAITKMHMRHDLGPGRWLTDTPGMTWPSVPPEVGLKLAATHSIGRNAYDEETVALDLAGYLLEDYPDRIARRYGALPAGADGHALMDAIACARKLVVKGGGPDLRKAGSVLLQEFRDGVLGRISLETVAQVAKRPVSTRPQ